MGKKIDRLEDVKDLVESILPKGAKVKAIKWPKMDRVDFKKDELTPERATMNISDLNSQKNSIDRCIFPNK